MQPKFDLQRWGARVGTLLASGALVGAIAMLAFAPRSGASASTGSDIYVANRENSTLTVYPAASNRNVAPSPTIGGSNTALSAPFGIALDASGNIYVANFGDDTVTVYPVGSNGNVAPIWTISGSNTGLDQPFGVALDASSNVYVANYEADTVTVYPAGSNGNVAPMSTIGGSNTGLDEPAGVALDTSGHIYVANDGSQDAGPYTVTVYPAGTTGNVAPSATIAGSATELAQPGGIAIGPEQPPTPTPTPPPPVGAKLTASPASLTFAARAEGTTSKPQVVTLTNAKTKKQNQTITVFGVSIAGDFAVPTGACLGSLAAGKKCKVSVTFTPSATGTRKGTLTVTSNAKNPSLTISLKGKGKK